MARFKPFPSGILLALVDPPSLRWNQSMIGLLERWGTFLAYSCSDTGACFDGGVALRATDCGCWCFACESSVFTNLD